jgi:chromosome segregation ATPase
MPPRPEQTPDTRVRPTLHPLAYTALIGAGLLLVLMVIGIGIQIGILQNSRDHIEAQDKKTAVLLQKVQAAQPTASQVPELLDQARPVVRSLGRAIGPVRHAIRSTSIATERLPTLVRAADAIARIVTQHREPLSNALASTNRLLAQIREQNLVAVSAEAARDTPPLIRELLRIQIVTLETQRRSLRAQRRSLRVQLATLAIQREALKHIESIDRKTGGTVPPAGAPVPQP